MVLPIPQDGWLKVVRVHSEGCRAVTQRFRLLRERKYSNITPLITKKVVLNMQGDTDLEFPSIYRLQNAKIIIFVS